MRESRRSCPLSLLTLFARIEEFGYVNRVCRSRQCCLKRILDPVLSEGVVRLLGDWGAKFHSGPNAHWGKQSVRIWVSHDFEE
jgi:hypothetical protein